MIVEKTVGKYSHISVLLLNWELWLMFLFVLTGCSAIRYVPTEVKTEYVYRDSTVYVVDTLKLPVERIVEVVPVLDTLTLETTTAVANAWIDTNLVMLKGRIENKPQIEVPVPIRTITKDSIVIKEIPVEVEKIKTVVPGWAWSTLVFSVLVILCFGVRFILWLK